MNRVNTPAEEIRARPQLASATAILQSVGLPTADLREAHLQHFFYCGPHDHISGLVGLELLGPQALLRSLAVRADARGRGLGTKLVEHAEHYAMAHKVRELYLLTTTAREFFEKRGYRCVDRSTAPEVIRATREFTSICPASAAFMMKQL